MTTTDHTYTACCLWEAALEALDKGEASVRSLPLVPWVTFERSLHKYRENNGTHAIRYLICGLAAKCDAAWEAMTDDERNDYPGSFDWDFCPAWLRDNFFTIIHGGL